MDYLASLREKILKELSFLRGLRCVFVMYPGHLNGGDGMIMLGTLRCLESLGVTIVMAFPECRFEPDLLEGIDYDAILIQGGGNFGDIWKHYGEFHRTLIGGMLHKKIVHLPVAVYFEDAAELAKTAAVVNSHPDYRIFVRDEISKGIVEAHFSCPVTLMPDMAFCLTLADLARGLERTGRAPVVLALRTDKERALTSEEVVSSRDWRDFQSAIFLVLDSFIQIFARDPFRLLPARLRSHKGLRGMKRFWYRCQFSYHVPKFRHEVKSVAGVFLQSKGVITDRMHMHVLAVLLGVPSVLLENNYHKNKALFNTWTNQVGGHSLCKGMAEAQRLLSQNHK